jgi:hypothetical protein
MRPKPVLQYPLADKQAVLDYVWHHFIIENKSFGFNQETNACVYNSPSGGCAVGCVLPQETREKIGTTEFEYGTVMKCRSVIGKEEMFASTDSTVKCAAMIANVVESHMDEFMRELQSAHDGCACNNYVKSHFKSRLLAIARDYLLKPVE